jgi:hypothetical protein
MFEKATKMKLRFDYKGKLSVEDVWDLNENELDFLYGVLNEKIEKSERKSLKGTPRKNAVNELRMNIVEHIYRSKVADREASEMAQAKKVRKQKILEIIENKKDAALQDMAIDDLKKLLEE